MPDIVDSFQQIASMELRPDQLALVADAMKLSVARFPDDLESRVDHMRGSLGFVCGVKSTNFDEFRTLPDSAHEY